MSDHTSRQRVYTKEIMPFYELDFDIEKTFTKDFSNEFYKGF